MNKINNLFKNKINQQIPIWFLRQAGRHIPEYYSIRSRAKNFNIDAMVDFPIPIDPVIPIIIIICLFFNC